MVVSITNVLVYFILEIMSTPVLLVIGEYSSEIIVTHGIVSLTGSNGWYHNLLI